MAIPHCGIGAAGSSAAACRNERSASKAQKECICATPWLKNSCAFGFEVVMGKLIVPCPVMMRAGKVGAVPPGGGAHMSLGFSGVLFAAAAKIATGANRSVIHLRRIRFLQFPLNQVTQLGGGEG